MHFMRLLQAKRNEQQWKITTPTGKNNLFNPLTWHLIAHLASLIDALYRCQSYIETNFFPAGFFFSIFLVGWLLLFSFSFRFFGIYFLFQTDTTRRRLRFKILAGIVLRSVVYIMRYNMCARSGHPKTTKKKTAQPPTRL